MVCSKEYNEPTHFKYSKLIKHGRPKANGEQRGLAADSDPRNDIWYACCSIGIMNSLCKGCRELNVVDPVRLYFEGAKEMR